MTQSDVNQPASDSFGEVHIPTGALWGAQTQRSLKFFDIGQQTFPWEFIQVLVHIKQAAAVENHAGNTPTAVKLPTPEFNAIHSACNELLNGQHKDQFPLRVWQTGSGTQTNMNVNEVIAHIATDHLNQAHSAGTSSAGTSSAGKSKPQDQDPKKKNASVHPNDHVNQSQSSNDVFPTAMQIAVAQAVHQSLLPALDQLQASLLAKQNEFKANYTVGRTHLMDALPLTVADQLSAYNSQLGSARTAITDALKSVYQLALGGTAVGSGANAPKNFGKNVIARLAKIFDLPLVQQDNLFAAVSGEDAHLRLSASLKQLAAVLFKMANDFRLLGSGPRCGFNEWVLPANEPGSSIMPGKVNPTQCEALTMVCLQVFGNDLSVSMAASNGQLQLNVYRPLILYNTMQSLELLSDAMQSFNQFCVQGLSINTDTIQDNMSRNLSAITLLAPKLGYDLASKIVHEAYHQHISLSQAAENLGAYQSSEFESLLHEQLMEQSA